MLRWVNGRLVPFDEKCRHCGKPYHHKTVRSKFCSDACKQAAYRERRLAKT